MPFKDAPWYTSYPVTPTLSVDAVQDKLVVESVVPEAIKLVGTVGACESADGFQTC
jgi:hypothetical protein